MKRIVCALLALLLGIFTVACVSGNVNPAPVGGTEAPASATAVPAIPPSPAPAPSPSPAVQSTPAPVGDAAALAAYAAVLRNSAAFLSVDTGKTLYWDDFLAHSELYDVAFEAARFAVLDMDGDGAPEVVVELAVGEYPEFFEILRYADGEVYGYNIVYRGLIELKADGTFLYSSGAADNGYGKRLFTADACEIQELGYMESSPDGDGIKIAYFIGDQSVTEEAFDAFAAQQNAKGQAIWYALLEENIKAQLAG